jgi:hypothetical protein
MTKDLTDKDPTIVYKLPKTTTKHMPAILDPEKVGELLRKIESYKNFVVRNALLLLALTFVRPFELRTAQWREINLNEAVWDIPQEKTKTKIPHRVFLSKQALEIFRALKMFTGTSPERYVFEGLRYKPISNATLNKALRILGYDTKTEITSHGFRAMARIIYKGRDITMLHPWERANLGIGRLFRDIRVFKKLTLLENLIVTFNDGSENPFSAIFGRRNEKAKKKIETAMSWLDFISLADMKDRSAENLS